MSYLPDLLATLPEPDDRLGETEDFSDPSFGFGAPGSRAEENLAHLSSGGRHSGLSVLCSLLHQILVGQEAERLLADGPEALPERGGMWVAPSFGWLVPRIDVGRKDRGPGGTRLRMPVRLMWSHILQPLPESAAHAPLTVTWTTTSMGHSGTGATALSLFADQESWEHTESETGIPVFGYGPLLDRDDLWRFLILLRDEGVAARWDLMTYHLEKRVYKAIQRAHASLRIDIAADTGHDMPLLDDTALERVCTQFVYGSEKHPGKVAQLISRLLDPTCLNKVDPQRYIEVALKRDCKEAVRQAVGDPRIGNKIRAMQRERGFTNIDDLINAFNIENPTARLSLDRAIASLTIGSSIDAEAGSLDAYIAGDDSEYGPADDDFGYDDDPSEANDLVRDIPADPATDPAAAGWSS